MRVDLREQTGFQDRYVKFEVSEDMQIEELEIRTWSSGERARLETQCEHHLQESGN